MRRGSCAYFGGGPKLECYGTAATCFDDASGSGAAESLSTHETARDGTKWEFMEFGVEA